MFIISIYLKRKPEKKKQISNPLYVTCESSEVRRVSFVVARALYLHVPADKHAPTSQRVVCTLYVFADCVAKSRILSRLFFFGLFSKRQEWRRRNPRGCCTPPRAETLTVQSNRGRTRVCVDETCVGVRAYNARICTHARTLRLEASRRGRRITTCP